MSVAPALPSARRLLAVLASLAVLVTAIDHAVAIPLEEDAPSVFAATSGSPHHLLVSEVMTGGVSASDEFIELYNPTDAIMPLEGLEVVYVTASGATVTRKASWTAGAPGIPATFHLLIANAGGIFAALGDLSYASGLAAAGGSVALRVIGAATAIDAVGWGNATSSWLETRPAPAPAAGSSLERLPGGSSGSSQDTDDNLVDFMLQAAPDPQNGGSAPISSATPSPTASPTSVPSATPEMSATPTAVPTSSATQLESPTPSAAATPTATPAPTPTPIPTPDPTGTPAPISIAGARSLPDGATVTVEGVALTAGDFADGGGYVADATAGIAVLVSDGNFSRGQLLRVTGTLDDRFAQRTIRSVAASIVVIGDGSDPLPSDLETGSIGEAVEGGLVEVTGLISSSASTLSGGVAWDLDDGSGPIRFVVGNATGIDTSGWGRGIGLTLMGVVGQRDSSGSGTSGFRVQPRDAADILSLEPAATPSPTPTPTPTATPIPASSMSALASPTGSPSPTPTSTIPLVSIGEARDAATGAHLRLRGVVTAQAGLLEAGSAVVQDSTGAILVRLGGAAGGLGLGQLVELDGTRATKAGMLSLRVTAPPLRLGTQSDPEATRRATGALGEADEARVVIARGVVSTPVSHLRGGSVSFAIDDGSGPIRVTISAGSGIAIGKIQRGAWLELRGVLGQETTASEPLKGYRLWPRASADLRVIAPPATAASHAPACCTPVKPPKPHSGNGQLEDALQGDIVPAVSVPPPTLARPHPTRSPVPAALTVPAHAPGLGHGPQAAGLVVSGIGLAALAGLAAWFARRRRPDAPIPLADVVPGAIELGSMPATPHLALVRGDAPDAQEERRILPPT